MQLLLHIRTKEIVFVLPCKCISCLNQINSRMHLSSAEIYYFFQLVTNVYTHFHSDLFLSHLLIKNIIHRLEKKLNNEFDCKKKDKYFSLYMTLHN